MAKPQTLLKLIDLNSQVWKVESRTSMQQGRCGCNHPASGSVEYKQAILDEGKLSALKAEMQRLTEQELDVGLSGETRARALALQIQWLVVEINTAFLGQHQLTAVSQPICKWKREYFMGEEIEDLNQGETMASFCPIRKFC